VSERVDESRPGRSSKDDLPTTVRNESSLSEVRADQPTTLADYLAIVRRRKWIVVVLPVIAAASAFVVAHGQSSVYRATAQVLVNRANIASAITSVDPTIYDATRFLTTEADVARSPALAARVVSVSGVRGVSAGQLLGESSISAEPNADVLNISVSSADPSVATRLTNAYAGEFARYKTELDTEKIDAALQTLSNRTHALRAQGGSNSPGFATLEQYQTQLETIRTLLANSISVLRPAEGAGKVSPRPKHTAILGALLGVVLGLALAFLVEALDRRVRSESEIEEILGLPLLGRVPRPPRHLRDTNGLVMLSEPAGSHAEAFRKLKTSIDFVNLDERARTIMVTSAVPREGKSTTIANLAVAFARSGRRVALVDLDLRQPSLHSFFYTDRARGITDVLIGGETLARAIRPRFLPTTTAYGNGPSRNGGPPPAAAAGDDHKKQRSVLNLLFSGTLAPAAGDALADLLESERLTTVLEELGQDFELVLADTPPLLAVGDAMELTSKVDAIIVVLQADIPRPLLRELARQLEKSRAPVLGFILTGVGEDEVYGGYGYGYGYKPSTGDARTTAERSAERV
jgi:succinoglycan biosynthesis transport protein ExoP